MIEVKHILDVKKYIDDVDAVIFDLDDTLYSEKDYVKSGFVEISKEFPEIPSMQNELWSAFERKEPAISSVLTKYGSDDRIEQALYVYRHHKPNIRMYDILFLSLA